MPEIVIKIVDLPEEFIAIKNIRIAVFQEEQGVESALEFDGQDDICDHLIAYLDGQPVGTTRIRYLDNQTAKIERLAVLPDARGQGLGIKITQKALDFIASKNISQVVIHAQEYVKGLYKKLDFVEEGDSFTEADILHVKMVKILE